MFDLEAAIKKWRTGLAGSLTLDDGYKTELEAHLRDKIADLIGQGSNPEQAFREAVAAMGGTEKIDAEFFKATTTKRHGRPSWQPPRFMPALLWNYVKIALRKTRRQKGYSFINIAGLALGMAACLLIISYIHHELSFDRFHRDADRIFRVTIDAVLGGNPINAPRSPAPLAPYLAAKYPEVRSAARILQWSVLPVRHADKEAVPANVVFGEPSVFDVFTFPLVRGDARTALARPYTAILSESAAALTFGTENPVGKFLKVDEKYDFEITGVMRDIPQNSHLQFDLLCSLETYFSWSPAMRDLWFGNFKSYTYLRLTRPEARKPLEAKLPAVVEEKMGKALKALKANFRFRLQPLTDIHLRSKMQWEYGPNGDILYVYIFAAIAVFILAIACMNFINLATARATRRGREVGLRKVVGARRGDLIGQFLGESIITSLASLLVAWILVRLALPLFKSLSGIELTFGLRELAWLVPVVVGLVLVCGIAAGSYPAFYLSSFQPVKTLKPGWQGGSGNARFRRLLVVSQFVFSIAMIIGTRTIADQIRYMKNKDLGFQKDQVLAIQPAGGKDSPAPERVKAQLKSIPGVADVAAAEFVPGQDQSSQSIDIVIPEGYAGNSNLLFRRLFADADFVRTMGMTIVRGRDFSRDFPSDAGNAILLNEEAARKTGWADPIGKTIKILADPKGDRYETRTVVGVVKDFHFSSLRDVIEPIWISNELDGESFYLVKFRTKDVARLLADLKNSWRALVPGGRFDYFFVDESFAAQYRSEERLNRIFSSFSLLAVAIACLGLFGLASYLAEQRKKEIGVRKVLGSSVGQVIGLLSREFLKLVGLAALIAWPIAYFAMSTWLRGFAYRTGLSLWTFLGSAAAALSIAFVAVGYQAYRAGSANPMDSLKYE